MRRQFSIPRCRTNSTRSTLMRDGQPLRSSSWTFLITLGKLPTPATHRLLTHNVRPINLIELTINFNRRNALYIQELYHRRNLAGCGRRNKSFHFGSLLPRYWHEELWFQQDGATCHIARATTDLLKDKFGDRLISRFGPVNWPPRSCDLTLLDYFLWGLCKVIGLCG
ncbi:uncharacterized protein TNCV_2523021 [Trichonephila clavipes]|nr:uncharacterized protein TNCV_2523021 [Trichonephila clavipes]